MHVKLQDEVNYVTKGAIVYNFIVMILLLITSTFNKPMILGLVFGTIIAVLNFRLLAITLQIVNYACFKGSNIFWNSIYDENDCNRSSSISLYKIPEFKYNQGQ